MKFIFHLFGTIFFVIWILIGLVLIVGGFTLVKSEPWKGIAPIMSAFGASGIGGLNGLGGAQFGAMQEVMKKMSQFGTVKGFYDSLKPAEQDCLKKQLGEKSVQEMIGNPQYKPTPEVALKGIQCLNISSK